MRLTVAKNELHKVSEKIGFWFAVGAMQAVSIIVLIAYAMTSLLTPVDDTDTSRWQRSGVKIITDKATGCQYLMGQGGGLILRKPCDGRQ